MSGNTTTSSNFTGLYGAAGGTVVPTTPYGNANVVSLLAAGSDGANTVGNISATGNITANYYSGNGSLLTGVVATGVGTLTSLSVTGNTQSGNLRTAGVVSATGNVTGAFFIGNGSQLTGITGTYGNANVVANLAALGSNPISTTGNISGGYFLGNGSQLTGLAATYGNANVAAFLPTFTGNLAGGNLGITNNANIGGNLSVVGTIFGTFSGNISGNLVVPGANTQVIYNNSGNAAASAGLTFNQASNLLTVAGAVSSAGNVTGVNILGNGSGLTSITGANVTGTVANATFATSAGTATTATTAGTVTTAAQANITSVGTLTSLSVSGTTQSGNLFTAGAVSATGNITGSNLTITTDAVIQGNLTVNGTTTTVNSNTVTINDKFINVANNAATAAAANGGGLGVGPVGSEYAALTYNSTSNAWNTSIPVSVTGNVSGNFFIGNGSQLTGVVATGIGTLTSLSVTGNVDAGNLRTAGQVSATGNVTGANINGNGSGLSSITGANVTGTVANATFATSAGTATTASTVTGNAQANITSVGVLTSLSSLGNITGSYILGNGSALTGIVATSVGTLASLSVTGNTQTGNLRTAGAVSATGNVTGNYFIGNGSQLTGLAATYGNANVVSLMANFGSNAISTTGNITSATLTTTGAGNIDGVLNVGQSLTVAGAIYATGSTITAATISATGNVTVGGNASVTGNVTGSYILGNGSQLTGVTANLAQFVTANAQANITSVGTLTGLSATGKIAVTTAGNAIWTSGNVTSGNVDTGRITSGAITATGNITATSGQYFLGDGSLLTGIAGSYGNAQVATFLSAFGSNTVSTTGNITSGNLLTTGVVSATGNVTGGNIRTAGQITATGNITGGNVDTGRVNSSNVTVSGPVSASGNITGNNIIGTTVTGTTVTATANVTGGNITTTGQMSATGNITGGNVTIPGGTITGLTVSATANITGGNLVTAGFVTVTGNITGGNVDTGRVNAGNVTVSGSVSASGNVTGAFFIGNGSQLTGISGGGGSPGGSNTQLQFNNAGAFAGNAAATFDIVTGNLVIRNTTFNTANAIVSTAVFDDTVVSGSVVNPGRILIGTGTLGNNTWTTSADTGFGRGSAVLVSNRFVKSANGRRAAGFMTDTVVTPAANISAGGTRARGTVLNFNIGGGASNFNWNNSLWYQAPLATLGGLNVGNDGITQTGNTVITTATAVAGSIFVNAGSQVTNGFGVIGDVEGNVVNSTAFAASFYNDNTATPANVYGYWMGTTSSTGVPNDNGARNATNYYFLRNDDPVAQAQLGSLRTFHEYRYDTAAVAGALTINKLNAQVQYVPVTAAITSVTFSNFVVSATTNTQTKYQTDTVTVLFRQDATGYAITLPTGSAYRYAGGGNTMGTTANAVQMLSVTAIYDSVTAATQYLITVSPEFV